ncbi:hypothetical protein K400107F7_27470 [Agathobaculum massiliense]
MDINPAAPPCQAKIISFRGHKVRRGRKDHRGHGGNADLREPAVKRVKWAALVLLVQEE